MMKFVFVCISFFVSGSIAGIAPFIKPCGKTDSDCMLASANVAIPHILQGYEPFGLRPLEPLKANDITTNSGELNLSFRNIVVHGLSKCKINKIERDPPKSTGLIDLECPLEMVGDYTASGQLLYVDFNGDGPFKVSGGNLHLTITIKLKTITKDGKKYYKISGFDFRYEPLSKFTIKFENLFNGDKEKAAPIEKVMDESWRELIIDENIGKKIIESTMTEVVNIISGLFQAIPIEEIEIEE